MFISNGISLDLYLWTFSFPKEIFISEGGLAYLLDREEDFLESLNTQGLITNQPSMTEAFEKQCHVLFLLLFFVFNFFFLVSFFNLNLICFKLQKLFLWACHLCGTVW